MLEIQALTYNDLAPVVPIAGVLPAEGGTIGRGPQNAIVLPDPMRLVSRQHLNIVPEAHGQYRLVNISGANLVYVNSEELPPGMGFMIKPGDKIYVGGYVLLLVQKDQHSSASVAGDLAQAAQHTAAASAPVSSIAKPTGSVPGPAADTAPESDLLAGLGQAPQVADPVQADAKPQAGELDDYLSVLFGDNPAGRSGNGQAKELGPSPGPGAHSDEVLDLLMQGTAARRQDLVQSLTQEGVDLHSFTGKGDSLINSGDATDHSAELIAEHGQGRIDALMGGNNVDPLALFGGTPAEDDVFESLKMGAASPVSTSVNHGSELSGLFETPRFAPSPTTEISAQAAPYAQQLPDDFDAFLSPLETDSNAASAPPTPPNHAVIADAPALASAAPALEPIATEREPVQQASPMSLDDLLGAESASEDPLAALLSEPEEEDRFKPGLAVESPIQSPAQLPVQPPVELQIAPLQAVNATPGQAGSAVPQAAAMAAATATATVAPVPVATATDNSAASHPNTSQNTSQDAQLYQALLQGLGLKEIPDRHQLDANFMHLIGQLLRCTSQGTVDLMAGRAVVKREVKANVTMIAPERNNPLKFSPDGEVALMYLLGRTYPGFMQPAEAMNNAYLDLRAHQIGLVSGMRSALGHVLDKFDPANIDNDTIDAGLLGGFGNGRKAKLWDAYGRYYQATRDEAEDRFQEFFGAAFLKAYEEATASLKLSEPPPQNQWGAQ